MKERLHGKFGPTLVGHYDSHEKLKRPENFPVWETLTVVSKERWEICQKLLDELLPFTTRCIRRLKKERLSSDASSRRE